MSTAEGLLFVFGVTGWAIAFVVWHNWGKEIALCNRLIKRLNKEQGYDD